MTAKFYKVERQYNTPFGYIRPRTTYIPWKIWVGRKSLHWKTIRGHAWKYEIIIRKHDKQDWDDHASLNLAKFDYKFCNFIPRKPTILPLRFD